jgi:hypothetical protein
LRKRLASPAIFARKIIFFFQKALDKNKRVPVE